MRNPHQQLESRDGMCLSSLRFKKIIPIPEQSMVQMLCYLLECLLTPENTPLDSAKEVYELYFVFAAVWAFGGALFQDQVLRGPLGRLQSACREERKRTLLNS